jgi:hypothetical protein
MRLVPLLTLALLLVCVGVAGSSAAAHRPSAQKKPLGHAVRAVTLTTLHFNGNLDDATGTNPPKCLGVGAADVVIATTKCATLEPTATLSADQAAKWVAQAAVNGTGDRNIYDPNWIWVLSGATALNGPMTINWWGDCTICPFTGADWTIRLWADGVKVFEQSGVTPTPATPQVPELLSATVNVSGITANSKIVLHVDPTFLDTGQGSTVYYDSSTACPGATAPGPCDSTVVMPVGPPTLARMLAFGASSRAGGVVLRWKTASEPNLAGFDVWRRGPGGSVRVNGSLIRARGGTAGAEYRFVDRSARPGHTYTYRLQLVDRTGVRAWYGTARIRVTR